MLLYVGKNFSATVNGAVIKRVACERCQTEYFYHLARTGSGSGTAPYYIGQDAAARRAKKNAQKQLEKRLSTEAEAVPCPGCGWIQYDTIQQMRKGMYSGLFSTTVVLASIALFFEVFIPIVLYLSGQASRETWIAMAEWIIPTVFGAGTLLALRKTLIYRFDPNQTFPQRPTVPAGTPKALFREVNDGVERYIPAEVEQTVAPSEWAEVQIQRCALPEVCCVCVEAPGVRVFKTPLWGGVDHPVPLCDICSRSITRRWWMWAALCLLLALGFAAGIASAVPRRSFDESGRWALFIVIGSAASIILIASIPRWLVKPFRVKTVDAARGVVRLWFVNREYTRRLLEQYEASSTVEFRPTGLTLDYSAAPPDAASSP